MLHFFSVPPCPHEACRPREDQPQVHRHFGQVRSWSFPDARRQARLHGVPQEGQTPRGREESSGLCWYCWRYLFISFLLSWRDGILCLVCHCDPRRPGLVACWEERLLKDSICFWVILWLSFLCFEIYYHLVFTFWIFRFSFISRFYWMMLDQLGLSEYSYCTSAFPCFNIRRGINKGYWSSRQQVIKLSINILLKPRDNLVRHDTLESLVRMIIRNTACR